MKQLCLSFLLMLLPMVANADEVNIDGINYNLFSDTQTAEVTKCYKSGEVIIPDKIDYSGITYTVTSFKDRAFSGCSGMTTLIIPNTITTVKDYCFSRCTGLKTITIPSSLTSISRSAFYMCHLEQIIVEEGNAVYDSRNNCNAIIETAYDRLYIGCKNTIIPNGIKEIGEFAFDQCNDLTSIVIPEGLFFIGVAAFQSCESLEEINFPSSLVFPGSLATFNICKSLQTIKSDIKRPSDLEADFPESVFANAVLIVPKGTRSAYQSCKGWKNFVNIVEDENTSVTDDDIRTIHVAEAGTLSNYITDADKYNIYDLTLTGELNGTDFRLLRDMAGHDCNNRFTAGKLKKLNLTDVRIVSGGERYLDTDTLSESAYFPGNCSYGKDAFRFSIEENDKVPKYVFRECMLEEVSLPNTAPVIDEFAFYECRYLKHVTIPDNVTTIGKGAFIYCHGLATITIPSSVTSIGESAFYQNGGVLQSVISEISTPFEIANNVFDNYSIPILTVPVGAKAAYQATGSWNNFMNITEAGSEETFPKRAFCVTKAGTLSEFISEADKYTIEELTLTGYLNGTDFRLLRDMAGNNYKGENTEGKLTKLDLSGVNIEVGGEMYLDATRLKAQNNNSFTGGNFCYLIEKSGVFPKFLFHGCNFEFITLPRSISQVENSAFGSCFKLKNVIVPGNYTKIDHSAFGNCYNLENIEVTSTNSNVSSEDGVLFNKDKTVLLFYPSGKETPSYTVPITVTELNEYAFAGSQCLTFLNLPNTLNKIGIYAFRDCPQLSIINLPAGVSSLHVTAFEGSKKLSEISVDAANEQFSSLDGVLFDKDRKTLICYPMGKEDETYTVPNGVNTIDFKSFQLCENLHNVTISNTVTSIAEWAFGNCTGLTTVNIPKSVTSIGNFAFYNCKKLATITSYNVEPFAIEKEVFWGTQSSNPAQSVDIYGHATLCVPLGCKDKYEVADGWKNFTTIEEVELGKTIHVATAGTLPDLISEAEKYEIEELTLTGELNGTDFRLLRDMAGCNHLGQETEGKLKILDFSGARIVAGGLTYVSNSKLPDLSMTLNLQIYNNDELPSHVFHGCSQLVSVKISESVTSVEGCAFFGCSNLTSVTIPAGVTTINQQAFRKCGSLASITIPNSVTSIGFCAFTDCRNLTSLTIPNSVTTIGPSAFRDCVGLTSIIIPKSVTSIEYSAFHGCPLTSIKVESDNSVYDSRNDCNAVIITETNTLIIGCNNTVVPNSIKIIGPYAFYNCSGLTSITLPNTLMSIGEAAFHSCYKLATINIPHDVTKIDKFTFYGCGSLTSVTIPKSVTSIGENAFFNCVNLTSVVSEIVTPFEIENNVFTVYSTATLTVPEESKEAYQATNGWKNFTNIVEVDLDVNKDRPSLPEGYVEVEYIQAPKIVYSKSEVWTVPNNLQENYNYIFEFTPLSWEDSYYGLVIGGNNEGTVFPKCSIFKLDNGWGEMDKRFQSAFWNYDLATNNTSPGGNYRVYTGVRSKFQLHCKNYDSSQGAEIVVDNEGYTTYTHTSTKVYRSDYSVETGVYDIPLFTTIDGNIASAAFMQLHNFRVEDNNGNAIYDYVPCIRSSDSKVGLYDIANGAFYCPSEFTLTAGPAVKEENIPSSYKDVAEAVDLGLSVKWASWNFGANKPEGYGVYLSWGEKKAKSDYSWDSYKWGNPPAKYNQTDGIKKLEDTDDVVRTYWKGCWRMPTAEEEKELYDNCEWEYTQVNSVNGYKITGPNGNSIFLPAAGIYDGGGNLTSVNAIGWYWSSTSNGDLYAKGIYFFGSSGISLNVSNHDRCDGHVIRPVYDETNNTMRTIHVATAGTLPDLISEAEKYEIEKLTLTGELNGTDFRLLRDMGGCNYLGEETAGKLKVLDLSKARVVKGGDKYVDANKIPGWGWSSEGYKSTVEQDDFFPEFVFAGCKFISVSIPNSVTGIGRGAFSYCSSLPSITIPNTVTSIELAAFSGCSGFSSISIPTSVRNIGYDAFGNCTGLNSLIIPNSVINISNYAFSGCSGLTSITVESGNTKYDSRNDCNAIIETETNTMILGCAKTSIPTSVTSIGGGAFAGSGITSITIPKTVTSIGGWAFNGCRSLTSVVIPNTVTSLDAGVFRDCISLSSITIPNSVMNIGGTAFYGCSGLTSITIPNSVTNIGEYAFIGCNELNSIISEIAVPFDITDNVFPTYSTATLTVPFGTKEAYQTTIGWKNFVNIVEAGLTPMENDDEIDYGEDGNVDENTDLEGTIIDNVYYNISPDVGGFDADEKCIVVNKSMSDEEIESVFGKDLQSDEVKQTYTGLVIMVPAGKGNLMMNAQATGGMTLKVKIGSADPLTLEFDGKMKVTVPYNVIKPTYVYIYAGEPAAASRRRTGGANDKSLRIYGIGIDEDEIMNGDVNDDGSVDIADAVCIVNHIVGKPTSEFVYASADVNSDVTVDIADAVRIVNLVVGKIDALARQRQTSLPEPE